MCCVWQVWLSFSNILLTIFRDVRLHKVNLLYYIENWKLRLALSKNSKFLFSTEVKKCSNHVHKRLVTSGGSNTIKLWGVGRQNLLSLLCHGVPVNWCSFDSTGGNGEYEEAVQYQHPGDGTRNKK